MVATSVTRRAKPASVRPGTFEAHENTTEASGARTPGITRKASSLSPLDKSNIVRQKTTRACDSCKVKKTKCTGTLPCSRCTRLSLPCEYNAAYSRGLPPTPLPASKLGKYDTERRSEGTGRASSGSRSRGSMANPKTPGCGGPQPENMNHQRDDVSLRASPEPGSTDFEGNYLGPASGVSFINRVWSRLHQDRKTHIPDDLQMESSNNTAVLMFGDKPYHQPEDPDLNLPPLDVALELVAIYFDFSMVTYRFLHRGSVEAWVKQIYEDNISISNPPVGIMVARTAIILMIFAVSTLYKEYQPEDIQGIHSKSERWYAASKYMSALESGPPRLETIQTRLIQCLYLLSSSRANECWYSFGTTLQVVTALGLHRKWPAKLSRNGCSFLESELRKRIFWSVYTLDKYLCIMFGRPRLLHDEDIDQDLPGEINDEDLLEENPARRTGSTDSMMIASVLHYRLGHILGDISRQLYSINPPSRDSPLETAARLTSELENWKAGVPPIFNSVQPSSLIPPLCRQSQVLQLAYSHAMIHVTRSFLLNDFTDLSRRPPDPHPMVSAHVHKCIKAAEDIMALVAGLVQQRVFVQSFWFTHYVCFCAILVVYIHVIQQHRRSITLTSSAGSPADTVKVDTLFALAETCQQYLAEATRKNCPSRRYSIILEELRQEVHRQISGTDRSGQGLTPMNRDNGLPNEQSSTTVGQTVSFAVQNLDFATIPNVLQPVGLGDSFDSVEDAGFLENLEGSIWWAQLDSWALSNFPDDSSTFGF